MHLTETNGSPARNHVADGDGKAGYKSWKKKYRKMRITFDRKMHDSEELHRQEEKASAIVKRLAIENDRLLDTLTEVNSLVQIPREKRIDLVSDLPEPPSTDPSLIYLSALEKDVPHLSYAAAKDSNPDLVTDLAILESDPQAGAFLTPDDLDDYIYAIDSSLFDTAAEVPSLAPKANPAAHPPTNPHLKNPTSVTNWLRKHAPKVFLQDGEESHATGGGDDEQHATAKKPRGKAAADKPAAKNKLKSARAAAISAAREASGDEDADMSGVGRRGSTPLGGGRGGGGAGKRKRDDDPGYRPKSGTRPTKKKRKSEGGESSSAAPGPGRKSKKETAAGAAAAAEGETPGPGDD